MELSIGTIISSIVLSVIASAIHIRLEAWAERYQPIKKLKNIKAIKYLFFILLYALPLGTIAYMMVDTSLVPNFKNVSLFIVICVLFVYNIIMRSINSIYEMIILGANKQNETNRFLDKEFENIYNEINGIKKP
jgi:hypothetical protein